MNLLEPKAYDIALKVFDNICGEWKLTEVQKTALKVSMTPNKASLIAMSRVFSIYKFLYTLYGCNEQANAWMHKDNTVFNDSAINVMQTAYGLEEVQKYLQAQISLMGEPIAHCNKNTKILFVCTANIQRSLTAEYYCRSIYPHIVFKSAGVSRKECERNNSKLCSVELLEWSDKIFVFEQMHIDRIAEHTGTQFVHKIHNLNIEDCYQYMQKELLILLQVKLQGGFSLH